MAKRAKKTKKKAPPASKPKTKSTAKRSKPKPKTSLRSMIRERTTKGVPKIRRLKSREAKKLVGKKSTAGTIRKYYKTKEKPNRPDTVHITLLANTDPDQIRKELRKYGTGKKGESPGVSFAASYISKDGKLNVTGTPKFRAGQDKLVEPFLEKLHRKLAGPGASKGGVKKGAESVKGVMIQMTFTRAMWEERTGRIGKLPPPPKPKKKASKKRAKPKSKRGKNK